MFCIPRRDLAVLLLHAGRLSEAAAELTAYKRSRVAQRGDPFDARLVSELQKMMQEGSGLESGDHNGGGGSGQRFRELPAVISIEKVLREWEERQGLTAGGDGEDVAVRPLTW